MTVEDETPISKPQPVGRHKVHSSANPRWLIIVIIAAGLLLIACMIALVFTLTGGHHSQAPTAPVTPDQTPIARTYTGPATEVTSVPKDLIARAKQIKPLEDIHKGDRVLYQGHVCTWQTWDKDITTSTIKCPGEKAFQIQTGRLTPVELKTGPSTLKVTH